MAVVTSSNNIKVSLIATFGSRFIGAAAGIIALPLYIQLIGIESYGLVGLFVSMQAIVSLFDFGLGPTVIREFAKSSNHPYAFQKLSDLAKACEIVYLVLAAIICSTLLTVIPWIVDRWININELNPAYVKEALCVGVFALSVQWPVTLYSSVLVGLHKQVELAVFSTIISIAKVVLTLTALYMFAPTIKIFFIVSLIFSFIQVATFRILMRRKLPIANSWKLCKARLFELKEFVGIMSGIALCSILLTQLDKVILSNLLTLKEFGVYSLVAALAGGLYLIISPVFSVIYPQLSFIISLGNKEETLAFYHKSAQLLSLILIPVITLVIFFSEKILLVWTGDASLSNLAKWPLIFLVIGNALNGMMNAPYALQLAYGKPKLALINNFAAIIFLLPSIYYLASVYGIAGGAFAWLILNILYVLISQYITHRKLLNTGLLKWYWIDVGVPFFACFLVTFILFKLTPLNLTRLGDAFYLGLVFLVALMVAFLLLPEMRSTVFNVLKNYKLIKK